MLYLSNAPLRGKVKNNHFENRCLFVIHAYSLNQKKKEKPFLQVSLVAHMYTNIANLNASTRP